MTASDEGRDQTPAEPDPRDLWQPPNLDHPDWCKCQRVCGGDH